VVTATRIPSDTFDYRTTREYSRLTNPLFRIGTRTHSGDDLCYLSGVRAAGCACVCLGVRPCSR
jgi:hypothetical protein